MIDRRKVQTFRAPIEKVQAVQFLGWQNADEIRKWATDVFYVPRGYDHSTRYPREYDRANSHLHEDAVEFLIVGGERADIGDWIVRLEGDDGNGDETHVEFQVYDQEMFDRAGYSLVDADTDEQRALDELLQAVGESHDPKDLYDAYNLLADALGLERKS